MNNPSSDQQNSPASIQTETTSFVWYRDISIMIPFAALLFSLFTSFIAYVESSHDEYLSSRTELRSLISELTKMNEDFTALTITYEGKPALLAGISSFYNTKNSILAQQASTVINRLEASYFGRGSVLDVEYMAVGQALGNSYLYEEALAFFREGEKRAKDSTTAAGSLRSIAGIHMVQGDIEAMRNEMSQAANIYASGRFSQEIAFKKAVTSTTTSIQWAQGELSLGYCDQAKQHLGEAIQLLPALPNSPIKMQLVNQARFLTDSTAQC